MDYFKWKELDDIDETKPFTPKQTKDEIKRETDNFTLDRGVFRYGFEEEARIAVKYLEQKGYHAEMNITPNDIFVNHESYNVWFSKEELPDGYESGEWLKEDLDESEEYFVGSVAIGGTPEEAQKEFEELGYNVRVEKSAIDHFDTYYLVDIYGSKEELVRLANDSVEQGLFTEEEIKSTLEEGKKKKKSICKGMGMWQWPNPEKGIEMFNHAVGADAQADGSVGAVAVAEELEEELIYGLYVNDKKEPIEVGSKKEMMEKKKYLEEVAPEDSYHRLNKYVVRKIGNTSWESLEESKSDISLPHLDALFETEGFNAPYEWEFEGEKEIEESPFHFTYRVEDDQLKIYDEHEEFSIDYGEEFGYSARDKKLDKIEKALKEDGFEDEVLEWENNVIMSIHIPEKLLKEDLKESKISWEDAIKDSYHSLVSSKGNVPTASQVLEDVADNYQLDIDVKIELDDPIKYNKWLSDVEHVLNILDLEVLGEFYIGKKIFNGQYENNREDELSKKIKGVPSTGVNVYANSKEEAKRYLSNQKYIKKYGKLLSVDEIGFIDNKLEEEFDLKQKADGEVKYKEASYEVAIRDENGGWAFKYFNDLDKAIEYAKKCESNKYILAEKPDFYFTVNEINRAKGKGPKPVKELFSTKSDYLKENNLPKEYQIECKFKNDSEWYDLDGCDGIDYEVDEASNGELSKYEKKNPTEYVFPTKEIADKFASIVRKFSKGYGITKVRVVEENYPGKKLEEEYSYYDIIGDDLIGRGDYSDTISKEDAWGEVYKEIESIYKEKGPQYFKNFKSNREKQKEIYKNINPKIKEMLNALSYPRDIWDVLRTLFSSFIDKDRKLKNNNLSQKELFKKAYKWYWESTTLDGIDEDDYNALFDHMKEKFSPLSDANIEAILNDAQDPVEESLTESTSKYPEFLGYINGTLEELNPEEFVNKVKVRRQSLHTNRIALTSEDEYIVYSIVCGMHGFGTLDDVNIYVDIVKEDWNRKQGVDMDDPESYKFEETQNRVVMEDCGDGPDKWDKAVQIIQDFKDRNTKKDLTEAHRDDPKVVELTNEIKDDAKELQDLGINTKNIIDSKEETSYNDSEEETIMEDKKKLEESKEELLKKYPDAYVPEIDEETGLPILPDDLFGDWEY